LTELTANRSIQRFIYIHLHLKPPAGRSV